MIFLVCYKLIGVYLDSPSPSVTMTVEMSLEMPVEMTVEVAVEASVEVAVEASVEVAVEASVEVAVEASVEVAVEASVEVAVEASVVEMTVSTTAGATVVSFHSPGPAPLTAATYTLYVAFWAAHTHTHMYTIM